MTKYFRASVDLHRTIQVEVSAENENEAVAQAREIARQMIPEITGEPARDGNIDVRSRRKRGQWRAINAHQFERDDVPRQRFLARDTNSEILLNVPPVPI